MVQLMHLYRIGEPDNENHSSKFLEGDQLDLVLLSRIHQNPDKPVLLKLANTAYSPL